MTEAVSEALSNLKDHAKDHAPSLPSAGDVREAVQSHLPAVDLDAVRSKAAGRKRSIIAVALAVLAGGAALFGYLRRHRTADSPASMYTPPLPKP